MSATRGRRLIAVIGIDRYAHWPQLGNAVRDATGAAKLFGELGFEEASPPLLDDQREHTAAPMVDPVGEGSYRVYRGGSWCSHARYVRAASGIADERGIRGVYLGFRLAGGQAAIPRASDGAPRE